MSEEQKMHFGCPFCSTRLTVPRLDVGNRGKCPACKLSIQIPNPGTVALLELLNAGPSADLDAILTRLTPGAGLDSTNPILSPGSKNLIEEVVAYFSRSPANLTTDDKLYASLEASRSAPTDKPEWWDSVKDYIRNTMDRNGWTLDLAAERTKWGRVSVIQDSLNGRNLVRGGRIKDSMEFLRELYQVVKQAR